jgi:hypothetical protein
MRDTGNDGQALRRISDQFCPLKDNLADDRTADLRFDEWDGLETAEILQIYLADSELQIG